jgi:hypothetical protein
MDEEAAAADVVKQAEAVRKDREALGKKERMVEQSLRAINQVGVGVRRGGGVLSV